MATKVINSLTFGDTYVFTTPYATSSTGASTQAKVATLTPNSNFSLETGVRVAVKFSAENTASSPTLNVNGSGAKTIQFRGAALTSSLYRWAANSVVEFMYDGTYWQMLGAPNNTDTNTNTNYYHTRVYSSGLKISTGSGVSDMYVPTGTTSSLGVVKQHTADDCTTYSSDEGATTPAAVKKAVGMFVTVTPNLTSGTKVGTITVNGTNHDLYCQTNTDTDTHYTTKLFATSSSGTAHAATTNGNTYLRLFDDSIARQSIKITGSGATTVTSDANGVITISSTDTNTNTDTKVTQSAAITTAGNYPVILGHSTATTAVTNFVNKSAKLLFNPGTSTLVVGSSETEGQEEAVGYLYVSGDAVIGGGSDSYGIIPGQDNYSHVGTSDRRWYQGYFSQLYCNSYFDADGTPLTSQFLPKSGGTLTGATTVTAGVALQLNTLKIPTSSGGTTYGVGTSGQVLKSNGSTVYWASDSNTTYSYPNLLGCSCSTAASTTAKTASLSGFSSTYLKTGATIFVRFTYAHTGTSAATLNVTSTGAKTIYRHGQTITSTNGNSWKAYEVVKMVYDGTNWQYDDGELTWNTL